MGSMGSMEQMVSARGKIRQLEESIRAMQADIVRLAMGVQEVVNNMNGQLTWVTEQATALVTIVGEDEVVKVVDENRTKALADRMAQLEAQAKAQDEALQQQLASGEAVEKEAVTLDSYLKGVETDPDGKARPLTFLHVKTDLAPEFQKQLLGKGKGFIISPTPGGGKFEVLGVYEFTPKPAVAVAVAVAPSAAEPGASSPQEAPAGDVGAAADAAPAPVAEAGVFAVEE